MQTLFPARGRALQTLWPLVTMLCALLMPSAVWASPFAYIVNNGNDSVVVVDTATNTATATIATGSGPYGLAVNTAGTRVYVANQGGNSVSVIDTASNTVEATVPVGAQPIGVAVNPAGTRAFVANFTSQNLSVLDTNSNTVTATVALGATPLGVAVNPAGTLVYASTHNGNTVKVLNTASNTVSATIAVGSTAMGIAINATGTRVYVANNSSNSVSVIDTASNIVIATVPVGSNPFGVAVSPNGSRVYVTNFSGASTSVIDTTSNTVVATVAVGTNPVGVSVHPDGTRAYVINRNSNNVSVIDTTSNTVTTTFASGGTSPYGLGNFIGPLPATANTPTDPIPTLSVLPGLTGIGTQPTVLDLGAGDGPAMTNCLLETVRALFGPDAAYLGQSANGVAKISVGGKVISFYALQASTGTNQGADIHLGGSNVLNVGTRCGNFNVTPALYSLSDFGSVVNSMGLTAQITMQGVITLTVGDTVYVARPDYMTTLGAAGTVTVPSLVRGGDGLYRLTDRGGSVQILRPAFLDTDALTAQVPLALAMPGWSTIQTDGTAVFSTLNGRQYLLTPDLTLSHATPENTGLLWWQASTNRYLLRSNALVQAQGFSVQPR